MKLIRQKGNTCFIACLAMCLDVSEDEVISKLGHDGQERVAPLVGNKGLRGVHPQELLDVCRHYDNWFVTIEHQPMIGQPGSHCLDVYLDPTQRFLNLLAGHRGIAALGTHAVAFDEDGQVYDPNGRMLESKMLREATYAWLVIPKNDLIPEIVDN